MRSKAQHGKGTEPTITAASSASVDARDAANASAEANLPERIAALRGAADIEVASSEVTRDINRDVVLERIRVLQPISRVDLARASGLQPSTVSSIVEQLLEERWVREGALVKTARGRRPTMLTLNDDLVFLVADVRPSRAVVALVDLNGRFLERQLLPLGRDPERSMAAIADVMLRFREHHPQHTFEGVGLSMPGRVNPRTNELMLSPNPGWGAFPISSYLSERLGMEVQLENAANASLLSELWFGRVGVRDAMLVTVSEGVGVAVLASGHLVHGKQGMAGEFGHICMDPAGPQCSCGARGCWEVYASSQAALRYYRALAPKAECTTFLKLMALAIDGNEDARRALEQQAHAIGQGLHLLNAVLAPEVILLAGDLTAFYEMYREILETECRTASMDGVGPQLRSIGDGEMARLRGAAAVVLQRHSGYYRAAHKRFEQR
jgi:predicted NBD/HSP70 family sugar kinase